MTREEAIKAAEVMMAYADGKDIEFKIKGEDRWETCDGRDTLGFEFDDFDYRIKIEKEYPKTYAECSDILSVYIDPDIAGYKGELLCVFQKLLICRDAYWKIAGEEMGLGKPWEPTVETVYCISRNNNIIKCSYRGGKSNIFEFPTSEMRDAFKENFGSGIEIYKELL